METLDYKHIANLVSRAQSGDSNAFAELYAATYQRQYLYAYRYLKDEFLAQDALQETYILALKNLIKLKDPTLVISWLNQILKLPFTESQVIIMKYYQDLKLNEIAQLMDISRSSVKRYLASGREHLAKVLQQD